MSNMTRPHWSDTFPTETRLVFGLFAMALDWTWAFVTYTSPVFETQGTLAANSLMRICGLAGMSAAFLVYGFFYRRFSTQRGNTAVVAAMLAFGAAHALLFSVGTVLSLPPAAYAVAWVCGGAATASLLIRLGYFYATLEKVQAGIYAALTLIMAGLLFAVIVNIGLSEARMLTCAMLLVACVLAAYLPITLADAQHFKADNSNPFRIVFSKQAPRGAPLYFLIVLFYSIAFGFTSALGAVMRDDFEVGIGNQAVFVLAGVLMMFVVFRFKERLNLSVFQWILLLFVAVGLLPLSFIGDPIKPLCCMILLLGFSCYDVVNWLMLTELSSHHNPVSTFGFGRAFLCIGLMLGQLLCLASLLLFNMGGSFVMAVSLGIVLCLFAGIILSSLPALKMYTPELEPTTDVSRGQEQWVAACREICEEGGLSPRECEVFDLLAKGRSTEVIQKALVISPHTVKAHTVHIYNKLGVHSRQELISMIEQRAGR